VFFPSDTYTSKARNNITFREQLIGTLPNQYTGVQFKSILADIPDFNLIQGIPAEFMHLVCNGMAKRMVNATFGLSKKHITTKTEANMDKIDSLLEFLKVPSEMSRRPRPINLSFYKSQVIIIHRILP
jgi:hypothetical protein